MEAIRQFDEGVTIAVPITEDGNPVDLTGATITLTFKPPGVPPFQRAGTAASGSHLAEYLTGPGDIGWWGRWLVQARVVFPGGTPKVRTVTKAFDVEPILEEPPIYVRPDPVLAVGICPPALVA